eukprot:7466126-Alexandrium_andersonii.AAC.1
MSASLVGSEMCIRDRWEGYQKGSNRLNPALARRQKLLQDCAGQPPPAEWSRLSELSGIRSN